MDYVAPSIIQRRFVLIVLSLSQILGWSITCCSWCVHATPPPRSPPEMESVLLVMFRKKSFCIFPTSKGDLFGHCPHFFSQNVVCGLLFWDRKWWKLGSMLAHATVRDVIMCHCGSDLCLVQCPGGCGVSVGGKCTFAFSTVDLYFGHYFLESWKVVTSN